MLKHGLLVLARLAAVLVFSQISHAAVGRTPGNFDVTSSGAATYTIPIFTPPGPHGMQPSIALAYSSSGGIGPLGKGWGIAGLSAISRCGKTTAQDTNASPVALATSDGYCKDGNRLRLTSGSYGVAGSTYQTEIADFSQVTAVGAAGNGPASFTVKGKDGLTYEYGNTTDSRVIAGATSTASIWMLNLITDRSGNKIKFTYKTPDAGTTGTTEPILIEWTADSYLSSTFVYSMAFGYGNNTPPSSEVGYVAGTEKKNDDLLTSISVSQSGTVKRKYTLAYGTSPTTGAYRLTTVTECSDAGGTDCLSPTTIGYQNGQAGTVTSPTTTISGNVGSAKTHYDFNGDGIYDLAYINGTNWYIAFGSSSGPTTGVNTGATGTMVPADLLGKGSDSFLSVVSGTWYVYSWNGSSFAGVSTGITTAASSTIIALSDVNGDGKADMVYVSATTSTSVTLSTRPNTSTGSTLSFGTPVTYVMAIVGNPINGASVVGGESWTGPVRGLDFNGDGREDIGLDISQAVNCVPNPWGGYSCIYANFAKGAVSQGAFQYAITAMLGVTQGGQGYYGWLADWNSDNCTDVVIGGYINLSGCNGSVPAQITVPGTPAGTADWDGDGRLDLLSISGATYKVQLSTGTGLGSVIDTGVPYTSTCTLIVMDVDGDGLDDIGCQITGTSIKLYRHNAAGARPDLATSFTDGYGLANTVTYTPATWSNHTKQSDSVYPNKDYLGPMQLVSSVVSSDGIGGSFTKNYWYFGAAINVQGRGFAGFASRKVTDLRNNAYSIDYYERVFPQTGGLIKTETYQSGATLISRRNSTLSTNTLDATANNQRYFVYPSAGDSIVNEVGGTANGSLILQTAQTSTFDNWGNVTASSSTVTDKDIASPQYNQSWTQASSATITPDYGTNWCLGLPTASSVTFSASNGEASVTRANGSTPDYVNCRMTQNVVEPGIANRRVDTTYGYDSFGNVNSVSVVGRDSAGTALAARASSIAWGTTGQFPISDTNPLTQTTQRTYNASFGALATQTDPNGIVVQSNQFDTFGRVTRSTRADGTSTVLTYNACATYGCENGDKTSGATGINKMIVIASQRDTSDAQVRADWMYVDQLERPIVQKSMTLSGTYSRVGRQYDAMGRVYREAAPCDDASCATTQYWVTNAYDLINRVTSQTRPQSQSISTLVTTTMAYAGRTQTVTDAQGKITTKILDIAGRMRRSQDHNGYYQVFGYDAAGSLKSVTDSLSNTLFTASYTYGIQAFQDSSSDTDLGARTNSYNSLAELTGWTDAKAQSFAMAYDALSRPTSRTEGGVTTTWTWGNTAASYNIGQLAGVSVSGYSDGYTYDNKGRVSQRTVTAGSTFLIDYSYTNQGMIDTLTYPTSTSSTRVKVKYGYQNGILKSVTDYTTGSAGTVYWNSTAQNARGQTTQETLGNGIVTSRAMDAVTGWMASVQSGVGGGAGVQNQSYLYDLVGNVTQRQENNLGLTENIYYDSLYRLTSSQLNSVTNLTVAYDAMGNITSRSDVNAGATWTYDTTKKHAVKTAGAGLSYNYDANGNMTSRNGSTIGWTAYNYPSSLATATESSTFSYTPDRQYYKQIYTGPGGTETTLYVGGILEQVALPGGTTDWRHYVYAEGQAVAIVSRLSTGTNSVSYPLEDHQGSSSVLTNASGGSIVKESFTAYGTPRNGATWSGAVPSGDKTLIAGISRRGYTYHSMLGDMGLIHMNGRVQDSITGRFLSPDPTIPNPGFTQSFNRYAYVNNNPLSYTDPSGFTFVCTMIAQSVNLWAPIPNFRSASEGGMVPGSADGGAFEVLVTSYRPTQTFYTNFCSDPMPGNQPSINPNNGGTNGGANTASQTPAAPTDSKKTEEPVDPKTLREECGVTEYVSDVWNSFRETIQEDLNVNFGTSVEVVFGHEDFGFYKYSLSVTGSSTDQITWTFEHGAAMPGRGAIVSAGIGPTAGKSWGSDINGTQNATFTYMGGAIGRAGVAASITQTSSSSGGSPPAKFGRFERSFGLGAAIFRGNGQINTGSSRANPIKYSGRCGRHGS